MLASFPQCKMAEYEAFKWYEESVEGRLWRVLRGEERGDEGRRG